MSKRNVTYQDIARYTGFSKTTVSRFFNHPETVRPEHQKRIREALEVFDYKENKVARILANGHTEIIGLIVPNLYLSFYAELLDRLLKTYDKYGYKFLLFSSNSNIEVERKYVSELQAYQAEGIIMLSHAIPSQELAELSVPVVAIEREDKYISSVNTDNYQGAVMATEYLRDQKCDMYFHINSQNYDPEVPASARIRAFQDVCEKNALPHEICHYALGTEYEDLKSEVDAIVERIIAAHKGKRIGIFCSSDTSASIVLNKIFTTFGCIPEEFHIIGFDGALSSSQTIVPLNTVAQDIDVLVDHAMSLLVAQIEQGKDGKSGGAGPHGTDGFETGAIARTNGPEYREPVHEVISPKLLIRG